MNERETNSEMPGEPPISLRILIADDNPDTLLTLRLWLEADGHVVRTVNRAVHVSRTVKEFRPDVCVIDLHMPAGSGFAIGKELKAMYGGA
jgi:CheY-like chemotaxis protein